MKIKMFTHISHYNELVLHDWIHHVLVVHIWAVCTVFLLLAKKKKYSTNSWCCSLWDTWIKGFFSFKQLLDIHFSALSQELCLHLWMQQIGWKMFAIMNEAILYPTWIVNIFSGLSWVQIFPWRRHQFQSVQRNPSEIKWCGGFK